jgi:hypothetical protein
VFDQYNVHLADVGPTGRERRAGPRPEGLRPTDVVKHTGQTHWSNTQVKHGRNTGKALDNGRRSDTGQEGRRCLTTGQRGLTSGQMALDNGCRSDTGGICMRTPDTAFEQAMFDQWSKRFDQWSNGC